MGLEGLEPLESSELSGCKRVHSGCCYLCCGIRSKRQSPGKAVPCLAAATGLADAFLFPFAVTSIFPSPLAACGRMAVKASAASEP